MKKILLVILTVATSLVYHSVNAQWCGTVNNLLPNPAIPIGFPAPEDISCAIQGSPYHDTLSFQMYSSFNFQGQQSIDSVTLDTVWNLPCGLCYSFNKASKTYATNELGVMYVTGTTNDPVGQYNLRWQVTAYINHDPTGVFIQNPNEVDAAGIKVWLRVATSAGSCAPVDTSVNGVDQVASANCPSGINEVVANVSSIKISPNPTNANAVLSFIADKISTYVLKIVDLTGKLISTKKVQVTPGLNTAVIERENLAAGMYMVSLSNGESSITKKLSVSE